MVHFKQDQRVVIKMSDVRELCGKVATIVAINPDDSAIAVIENTTERVELWPEDCKPV